MRLVIVGCGLIGSKRAAAAAATTDRRGLRSRCRAPRAACATDRRSRAGRLARGNRDDADAVVDRDTHDPLAPIALAAVEAGSHVLVEKPAGRRPAEVAPLLRLPAKRRIVKVGFNHRFHPAHRRRREIVDDGAIGPLLLHPRPLRPWRPYRL